MFLIQAINYTAKVKKIDSEPILSAITYGNIQGDRKLLQPTHLRCFCRLFKII